uniref:Kinesin-like protein KIF6/9 C-terminal domain-containing protein n=1 Tax=Cyanoderma ruficeps TaxID=181631 RepID=A0A8C3R5M6_9PASS
MSLGCQEAFEVFKRDHADSITIEDNKQLLKQRFDEAKCLGEKLNEVRNKINICWKICNALSSSDISYKTVYSRFKGLKVEIEHLQLLMEKVKKKLQKDFEVWWSEECNGGWASSSVESSFPYPSSGTKLHNWFLYVLLSFSIKRLCCSFLLLEDKSKKSPSGIFTRIGKDTWLLSAAKLTSESCTAPHDFLQKFTNILSYFRTAPSSSIPLTGDSQADADILAFIKARQNILQKKGKSCQKTGSQTKISSTAF